MNSRGSILIADGEESFRQSTCRLLQRERYTCCGVGHPAEAIERLRRARFDLLLTDLPMPSNGDAPIVQTARELDDQLPVIVITGHPSLESAVWAMRMSAIDYLTKPLDVDRLLPRIRAAIAQSRSRRALSVLRQRLSSCVAELEIPTTGPFHDDANARVPLGTIRTLAACLSELLELAGRTGGRSLSKNLCQWLDCPQSGHCLEALTHAVDVLKQTKGTFKSKVLADLRRELELKIDGAADSLSQG